MIFAKTKDGARIHAEGRESGEVHLVIDNIDEPIDIHKLDIRNAEELVVGLEDAIRGAYHG